MAVRLRLRLVSPIIGPGAKSRTVIPHRVDFEAVPETLRPVGDRLVQRRGSTQKYSIERDLPYIQAVSGVSRKGAYPREIPAKMELAFRLSGNKLPFPASNSAILRRSCRLADNLFCSGSY